MADLKYKVLKYEEIEHYMIKNDIKSKIVKLNNGGLSLDIDGETLLFKKIGENRFKLEEKD